MPNTRSAIRMQSLSDGTGANSGQGSETLVSVSTRFNPEEQDMQDADLVLAATDNVYFYTHRSTLLHDSSNGFGSILSGGTDAMIDEEVDVSQPMDTSDLIAAAPTVIAVGYASDVLNVVLHAIYGLSVLSYRPPPSILRAAIIALSDLGYQIDRLLVPHSEIYMLFLQAAATEPLQMYALAAQLSLEPLAVSVSTFTLAVPPSDITDEVAAQMGPSYLRRLFFLHLGRTDALKRLLYPPPAPHPVGPGLPTPDPSPPAQSCAPSNHQAVARIWAFASSAAVIDNHPNNLIQVLTPMSAQLPCVLCRQTLMDRVRKLVADWSAIKNTI